VEDQLKSEAPTARAAARIWTSAELPKRPARLSGWLCSRQLGRPFNLICRQKGATQEQIEKSGLVVRKDEGGSYDRFRGRLMFPVIDAQGRAIAFGGPHAGSGWRAKVSKLARNSGLYEGPAFVRTQSHARDEIRRQALRLWSKVIWI